MDAINTAFASFLILFSAYFVACQNVTTTVTTITGYPPHDHEHHDPDILEPGENTIYQFLCMASGNRSADCPGDTHDGRLIPDVSRFFTSVAAVGDLNDDISTLALASTQVNDRITELATELALAETTIQSQSQKISRLERRNEEITASLSAQQATLASEVQREVQSINKSLTSQFALSPSGAIRDDQLVVVDMMSGFLDGIRNYAGNATVPLSDFRRMPSYNTGGNTAPSRSKRDSGTSSVEDVSFDEDGHLRLVDIYLNIMSDNEHDILDIATSLLSIGAASVLVILIVAILVLAYGPEWMFWALNKRMKNRRYTIEARKIAKMLEDASSEPFRIHGNPDVSLCPHFRSMANAGDGTRQITVLYDIDSYFPFGAGKGIAMPSDQCERFSAVIGYLNSSEAYNAVTTRLSYFIAKGNSVDVTTTPKRGTPLADMGREETVRMLLRAETPGEESAPVDSMAVLKMLWSYEIVVGLSKMMNYSQLTDLEAYLRLFTPTRNCLGKYLNSRVVTPLAVIVHDTNKCYGMIGTDVGFRRYNEGLMTVVAGYLLRSPGHGVACKCDNCEMINMVQTAGTSANQTFMDQVNSAHNPLAAYEMQTGQARGPLPPVEIPRRLLSAFRDTVGRFGRRGARPQPAPAVRPTHLEVPTNGLQYSSV